jgi:hypothetical protein
VGKYRNGLIHTYQPRKLRNSYRTISWIVYKGGRTLIYNVQSLEHLVPYIENSNEWKQPISITCLYHDLIDAIDFYVVQLSSNPFLEANFRRKANELLIPVDTKLKWW